MPKSKKAYKQIVYGSGEILLGSSIIIGGTLFAAAGGAIIGSTLPMIGTAVGAGIGATIGATVTLPIGNKFIKNGINRIENANIKLHNNSNVFFNSSKKDKGDNDDDESYILKGQLSKSI